MPLLQLLADLVPEVGRDVHRVFGLLRRAGHVDHHAGELPLLVPEEEQLHAVVFVAFDRVEALQPGVAVHGGLAVEVRGPAVVAYHGLAEGPAHAARLAPLPGPDGRIGQPRDEEIGVLRGLHHARVLAHVVEAAEGAVGLPGAGVRVGAVEEKLPGIEIGQLLLDGVLDPVLRGLADADQVAGDHDRLLLAARPGRGSPGPAPWQ